MFDRLGLFGQRFLQTKQQLHHKNVYLEVPHIAQSIELLRNAHTQEMVMDFLQDINQNQTMVLQLTP